MRVRTWLGILAILVTGVPPALAQVDNGRIAGIVRDSSGALATGVTAKAKNERTGEERSAVTNDQGYFLIAPLKPSTYTIRVERTGFGNLDAVTDRLLRNPVHAFDANVGEYRPLLDRDSNDCPRARSGSRATRDFHVIELTGREDIANGTLDVAVIQGGAGYEPCVTSNCRFVNVFVAADRNRIGYGAASKGCGVLRKRRSARRCQTQQHERQSGHGGNIHESARRVHSPGGRYPLPPPNVGDGLSRLLRPLSSW